MNLRKNSERHLTPCPRFGIRLSEFVRLWSNLWPKCPFRIPKICSDFFGRFSEYSAKYPDHWKGGSCTQKCIANWRHWYCYCVEIQLQFKFEIANTSPCNSYSPPSKHICISYSNLFKLKRWKIYSCIICSQLPQKAHLACKQVMILKVLKMLREDSKKLRFSLTISVMFKAWLIRLHNMNPNICHNH